MLALLESDSLSINPIFRYQMMDNLPHYVWTLSATDYARVWRVSAYIRRWKAVSIRAMAIELAMFSDKAVELIEWLEFYQGLDGVAIDGDVYVLFDPAESLAVSDEMKYNPLCDNVKSGHGQAVLMRFVYHNVNHEVATHLVEQPLRLPDLAALAAEELYAV